MIVAAAAAPAATNGMPFNWFDMLVVVVLGFGLFRGRRNGMSKELLPLLEWLVMVPVCGLGYPMLAGSADRSPSGHVVELHRGYLALAVAVFVVFAIFKRASPRNWSRAIFSRAANIIWACWREWSGMRACCCSRWRC